MRWLLLASLVLGACREPEAPIGTDAPRTEGRVRVATFNVQRFFDTVCQSGSCAPGDYEALATPQQLDARAAQLATAIRALEADVVSLQEIETQACLDALLARVGDVLPHGVLGEINTAASVDVAVLSKTPLDMVLRHRATERLTLPNGTITSFSRELLEVHVRAGGAKVVVFATHFRSKVNDDPARRLAEAQVSSRVVGARAASEPDALVVLGGDLNDTPGSPPLDALTVGGGLIRVADDLPPAEQATYVYQGNGQSIDHLLLAPGAAAMRVPRSSRVWRDGTTGYGGSDHRALTSDFVVSGP
jgi:uncharacterized protein